MAIEQARRNLAQFPDITISVGSVFGEDQTFRTIFLWDVAEHIEDDGAVFETISSLLLPGGYLLIAVPSNPREWRWEDDFYGHYRRYTREDMTEKIHKVGLEPVVLWDFTYPVFWIMRRLYTMVERPKTADQTSKLNRTLLSATVNAWDMPFVSGLLNRRNLLWDLFYRVNFLLFRNRIEQGHEMFVLAQKPAR